MYLYQVAIPVNIRKLFSYQTPSKLEKGTRVLINFHNSFITGFIWEEDEAKTGIKYKNVLEVVDSSSIIPIELINLAEWINRYYSVGLGIVLSAMLPPATQIQLLQEVKKILVKEYPSLEQNEQEILNLIPFENWTDILSLKQKAKNKALYSTLEKLEDKKLIEIKRTYDQKLKKKYANFVLVNDNIDSLPKLTVKQQQAWDTINGIGKDFPLKAIADLFSYSIVKALRSKGLINIEAREVSVLRETEQQVRKPKQITLTDEQNEAVKTISEYISWGKFHPFLLFGVTGSGKTEVYIELIKRSISENKNAIVLVPEIALTPQMEERFISAFGDDIAVVHSHRNERERWEEWKRIKNKGCRIVLGARSAIFAPMENIGVIIVDEEHENSYKQDKNPRYNARDLAVMRAKYSNAVVVLGSATPSLESWYNASLNKYKLIKLTRRPANFTLPTVTVVDMKEENGTSLFSDLLKEKILDKLKKKEQIILLHNRRGYSTYVLCMGCGHIAKCPHCDVSMIYHSDKHKLICHYCSYHQDMLRKCSKCGSYILEYGTAGTQQLEKQLQIEFPSARLLRMDTDTTTGKDSYVSMFNRMREGVVDILFGTQMIAKGLDFEGVTLVGVIAADNSINIPDFRAAEKTFQLLTQVAGRSGRGEKVGEVVIQTYNPEHYAIVTAQEQNFISFVEQELYFRNRLSYPPYFRIARFVFSSDDEIFLQEQLNSVSPLLDAICNSGIIFLGPSPAPINKINNKYRYHLIIKSESVSKLMQTVAYLNNKIKISKQIKCDIDIDPVSLM